MALTTAPTTTPLSQALTRRRANPLPGLLLGLGLIAACVLATLGYLESRRTEQVVLFVRDVPYGQQIRAEDLGTLELPLHRPAQLSGIANPATIVGQYAARNLGANDLAQPTMLMADPPSQPTYPNGEQLAPNMVPLPFATTTIGPISFRDRVNIGFSDPSGDPAICDAALNAAAGDDPTFRTPSSGPAEPRPYACRLLSSVRVLYVDEDAGIAYLELSPYQAQTIWAIQAANLPLWGERYGVTSDTLGALERLDIGQVSATQLTAPVPTPQTTSSVPGGSPIPGLQP